MQCYLAADGRERLLGGRVGSSRETLEMADMKDESKFTMQGGSWTRWASQAEPISVQEAK